VAIRFPTGKPVIRRFLPSTTLTALYAFVDAQLVPPHFPSVDDPTRPPEGQLVREDAIEHQISLSANPDAWWCFKLALAYPRREIGWQPTKTISQIDGLREGGQLVVELITKPRSPFHNLNQDEDGYDTEESD